MDLLPVPSPTPNLLKITPEESMKINLELLNRPMKFL